jgi:hypothetical protein
MIQRLQAHAATITRPDDTTAYAAKDAIADSASAPTALTFTRLGRELNGEGYITGARIATNQAANVARFKLHLYRVAPTAINDNAAFTLLWANRATRIGAVTFAACATEGTGSDMAVAQAYPSDGGGLVLPFKCASTDDDVYGLLETLDAFTPAALQVFYIELTVDQY